MIFIYLIFQLACEGQFDCNLPFRAELKKLNLTSDKPVGSDQSGRRYWLLRVREKERLMIFPPQ